MKNQQLNQDLIAFRDAQAALVTVQHENIDWALEFGNLEKMRISLCNGLESYVSALSNAETVDIDEAIEAQALLTQLQSESYVSAPAPSNNNVSNNYSGTYAVIPTSTVGNNNSGNNNGQGPQPYKRMATYAMPREEQDLMPNNNNSNNNSNSNNNTNNNYNHNNNDNSAGGRVDLSAQSARSFFSGFPSLSNFFSQSQSQPHLHSQTQRNNARTFFSLNGDDDEEKMLPLSTSYVGSNVDAARSANNGNNNNASGPNLFLHNEEEGKDAADRLLELLKKK